MSSSASLPPAPPHLHADADSSSSTLAGAVDPLHVPLLPLDTHVDLILLGSAIQRHANDDDDDIDNEEDHELRCFDGTNSPRSIDATARVQDDAFIRIGGELGYAALQDHNRQKERERTELVQMILESIANVPVAVERIHTNEKLLAALQEEMGNENALLRRFFSTDDDGIERGRIHSGGSGSSSNGYDARTGDELLFSPSSGGGAGQSSDDDDADSANSSSDESSSSSGFGSDYEKDLAEAVHQLCMSDDTLVAMEKQISAPIVIASASAFDAGSASGSPQSSINFGASPGNNSQDGEPVSALWPRQPHQFAFTQEEEANARGEDEVYSELISSMCEDESFRGEEDGDDDAGDDENEGDDDDDEEYDATAKVFDMDEDDNVMDARISAYRTRRALAARVSAPHLNGKATAFHDSVNGNDAARTEDNDEDAEGGDGNDDDDDDEESDDEYEREYEVVELRIIREKNKTGFEPSRDWRPRVGSLIGGRYKVELAIGEAVFSRTYKCVDTTTSQIVCLKIIKNNKEYFDQGVDEIRLLQFIASHCNVDAKHLVRLLDYFYFREHLIIVTELLRDNLYEFSKLLLERGVLNYFSMPRLKKIAIEVLEALQTLHALGIVHCDLKPENILISSFNECRVKVIDFGSACFVTDELTSYVQSRSYRAPEVILGLAYDQKIDVWSLGCVLAELFTGEVLFRNDSEQTLLARIIAAIGPVPSNLLEERDDLGEQFRASELFAIDARGDGVLAASLRLPLLEQVVQTGDRLFIDFLRGLLRIDPARRLSATQALQHPWLASGVFSAQRT